MAVLHELAQAAERFEKWAQLQDAIQNDEASRKTSAEAEREMAVKRAGFDGASHLSPDDSLFFEQLIEGDDLMPIRYFELGRLAARPVARIRIDLGPRLGEGNATGFLVAPGLLLTNHHVFPSAERARIATVSFDAEDDVRGNPLTPRVFKLRPEQLYFADKTLDFCCVAVSEMALDGRTSIAAFGYLRLFAQTGKILRDEYATVIQHPRGRQKQVAARNNKIVVYVYDGESSAPNNDFIYYQSDTQQGSSGAPVFSDQFFVVALHRRGVPKTRMVNGVRKVLRTDGSFAQPRDPASIIAYEVNEGVRVSRILGCLRDASATDKAALRALQQIDDAADGGRQGPFWVPAAPPVVLGAGEPAAFGLLEIQRRKVKVFADAPGYDPDFLPGFSIGLPQPRPALAARLAPRIDGVEGYLLPFNHFTTAVHARRRMPIFAAVNIDGASKAALGSLPKRRPPWSYDPRLAEDHQLDDSIHSNMLQRGHLAARDFIYWGADADIADVHSFTLSNVCPQMATFNGQREWSRLESSIMRLAETGRMNVTVFMGPILSRKDPLYDDLRSENSDATVGSGIRLPTRFWYIALWVKAGVLTRRCYLLDQGDDIDVVEGGLELDIETPATVVETTVENIAKLTGLDFPDLPGP